MGVVSWSGEVVALMLVLIGLHLPFSGVLGAIPTEIVVVVVLLVITLSFSVAAGFASRPVAGAGVSAPADFSAAWRGGGTGLPSFSR